MYIAHVSNTQSGVAELSASGFSLDAPFPNPADKSITFQYSLPATEPVTIQFFDDAGRLIQTEHQGVQSKGSHIQPIDISMLSIGSYHYQILAGSESFSGALDTFH